MNSFKTRVMLGASALALASAIGANAYAATIFGGGSTLLAPVWTQQAFCYDDDAANQTYLLPESPLSRTVNATTATGCPDNTGTLIRMDATASGIGEAGLFANSPVASLFGTTAGTISTTVQYGLSDNSLVGTDLAAYDKGTGATETFAFQGNTTTATAPASLQGLTFSTAPVSGTNFPISKGKYGPMVQFPVSIDPVAITYNPTYTSGSATFTFNIKNGAVLHLSKATYCGIFTGAITNWNDAALTADNANTSLKSLSDSGTFSVPIKLVGRSDSSGTTSIFTRHLATVCGSADYTAGTTTLPSSVVALFSTQPGSNEVASTVASTQGAMGYIGADYVLPAVTRTGGATNARLAAAALANSLGAFVLPTATAASAAFGALAPPQSNSDGTYKSADTTTDRHDPTQWVQSTAAGVPLANPTATGSYPIVGTTNFIGYTCYASGSSSVGILQNFLNFGGGATGKTILNNAALGQLPTQWLVAIGDTFLNPTSPVVSGDTAAGLDLFIATVGATGSTANPACAVSGVTGG